jgi:hypothetical protein
LSNIKSDFVSSFWLLFTDGLVSAFHSPNFFFFFFLIINNIYY